MARHCFEWRSICDDQPLSSVAKNHEPQRGANERESQETKSETNARREMIKLNHGRKILLLFLLALLGSCLAQTQPASQPQIKTRRLLMWKASSPTTTVYLLGSIHLGDKDMYPLPEAVESAFSASKLLVVEINIKDTQKVNQNRLLLQYGFYPEGDSLSNHLPKKTAMALGDFCIEHRLPRILLEKMKPWAVAATIEVLAFQQAGEDPALGIDLHFLNEAKQQKIEELETADFQMTALSSGTEAEQQQMLADTLKELAKPKDHIDKMKEIFLSGDPETLQKFLEENNTPKSLFKRLLIDRNGPMAERIEAYLKGNDQCFVVVGAAHLVGDQGIVKLLQQKDYKVELITAEMKQTGN